MTRRHDIYVAVTAQIAAAIEAGAGEWRMPWHHSGAPVMRPTSAAGRRYSGINRLVLWAAAEAHGYTSGVWATYNQWKASGAQVRKGEVGTHVVLWKKIDRADDAGGSDGGGAGVGEGDEGRSRFYARSFVVFNRAQVDGAPEEAAIPEQPMEERVASALGFFAGLGIPVEYGLHDAHYRPDLDRIFMPDRRAFKSDVHLVSTLAHEVTHATGAAHRLDRETLRDYHKGLAIRAREELVADIGSAFLLGDLGLAHTPRPDHAAYVASWLRVLRDDPRAIFAAAAKAQAASDWMHAQQPAADPLPIAA
jgi:antirestriction protein ArdC